MEQDDKFKFVESTERKHYMFYIYIIFDYQLIVNFEVVVKKVYNGVLDFYVDYGFASSIYDDWFWKIFYEKGSQGNKFSIWISDFDVYEEQRHMGICS